MNATLNPDTIIEAEAGPLAFPAKLWKAALNWDQELWIARGMDCEVMSSLIIEQNDRTIKSKRPVHCQSHKLVSIELMIDQLWWKERKQKWGRGHIGFDFVWEIRRFYWAYADAYRWDEQWKARAFLWRKKAIRAECTARLEFRIRERGQCRVDGSYG